MGTIGHEVDCLANLQLVTQLHVWNGTLTKQQTISNK